MNKLDLDYQNLLRDILDNGVEKEDRTGTGTISLFGRQLRHNMSSGFPLLTTKKMAWKQIVTELMWFLRGDTNIKYLLDNNCHIWDGDCYKRYHQAFPETEMMSKEDFINLLKKDSDFCKKWGDFGKIYGHQWRHWQTAKSNYIPAISGPGMHVTGEIDQIKELINEIKTNPDSRRLMVTAWNPGELDEQVLPPCHYGFQIYTRKIDPKDNLNLMGKTVMYKKKRYKIKRIQFTGSRFIVLDDVNGELIIQEHMLDSPIELDNNAPTRAISLMFNMRSVDAPLGLPFNIASYGLLLEILGKIVNMVPDELICNLGDVHIYQNQVEGVKEQLSRIPYDELPNLKFSKEVLTHIEKYNGTYKSEFGQDFGFLRQLDSLIDSFTHEDFIIENYKSHPLIKIPLSN